MLSAKKNSYKRDCSPILHGGQINNLVLRNTVYFKRFCFDPCGRYGRFCGATDRSNRDSIKSNVASAGIKQF